MSFFTRLFRHAKLAREMTYHARHRQAAGDICDFQDGSVYAAAVDSDAAFASEPRNGLAGFITDGIQPHADDAKYSMWPFMVTLYNMPPHVRYLLGVTTLLCVLPGSRIPSSRVNLHFALQIVMDEFKLLSYGVRLWDQHETELFWFRAKLVQVTAADVVLLLALLLVVVLPPPLLPLLAPPLTMLPAGFVAAAAAMLLRLPLLLPAP